MNTQQAKPYGQFDAGIVVIQRYLNGESTLAQQAPYLPQAAQILAEIQTIKPQLVAILNFMVANNTPVQPVPTITMGQQTQNVQTLQQPAPTNSM